MHGQRVLVTGGAGFIGSNIANTWAEDNEVIVVDDLSLGRTDNLIDEVEFHERSVLEADLPTDVDVVVHFAAKSTYAMHEEDPTTGAAVNVEGFVNVVEQARNDGCDRIVYASTSSVYGDQTEPTPESTDITASTGYEASKLARERYAEYFSAHYDMAMTGLRPFSVYQGYGGNEAHKDEFANIIAQFADVIANGEPPVVYGDGTHSRDFIHVDDVVAAVEAVIDADATGRYNVGTGERYTANEVVERLNELLETDIEPTYVDNPIDEDVFVSHTCADIEKLTSATEWTPTIDFEEGLARVCEPYLSNEHRLRG